MERMMKRGKGSDNMLLIVKEKKKLSVLKIESRRQRALFGTIGY